MVSGPLSSNIPRAPSYGVLISQLVRLCRINSSVKYFKKDVTVLVSKFLSQGFNKTNLIDKYIQFTNKYVGEWAKYGVDITTHNFIRSIF